MDPDTALETVRQGINWLTTDVIDGDRDDIPDAVAYVITQVVESFTGLDEWLSKGGFKPSEWLNPREVGR